jgi:predicted extracellular nuclease
MGQCPDATYERFDITGDLQVQSALAAMPSPDVGRGDCFSSVTGIVTYFFDYQILPRQTAEISTGGTSCPTENQLATCGDNIDNDGNGFKDCGDNDCIAVSSSCRTVTTIQAIQTATTPPTGGVELQNVCVVSLSSLNRTPAQTPRNMWVQTANTTATLNNGIFVFGPGNDLTAFASGTKVNVIGTVKEFNDKMGTGTLTEIQAVSITAGTGTCTPAPILAQTAANLSIDANGEPAESVLVQLDNVKVTTAAAADYYTGTMLQGSTAFKFDDDAFRTTAAKDTCYDTINGFWSYNVYDNAWIFLPTQVGDTSGGSCP